MPFPPGQPAGVIDVPDPVEAARILGVEHPASEEVVFPMRARRGDELFQPVRMRKGVGGQKRQPLSLYMVEDREGVSGCETEFYARPSNLDGCSAWRQC